jgi:hypothetical protein
MTISEYQRS